MWEWREESARGRWRLDRWGSWVWDEPSPLERPGAGTGALEDRPRVRPQGPRGEAPWAPDAAPSWWGGPPPAAAWRAEEPRPARWRDERWGPEWSEAGGPDAGGPDTGGPDTGGPGTGHGPEDETPIFRAVADDRHRRVAHAAEDLLGRDRPPLGRGVPVDTDDRYDTAPRIPLPHPGSGPFPAPGPEAFEDPQEEVRRRAARRRARRGAGADAAPGTGTAPGADAVPAGGRHAFRS